MLHSASGARSASCVTAGTLTAVDEWSLPLEYKLYWNRYTTVHNIQYHGKTVITALDTGFGRKHRERFKKRA